ncbi:MAG: amidohydrolase [Chloroflexota bacterium]|nr:MAG: amidohydrolase [Chloroflexota bacterium]
MVVSAPTSREAARQPTRPAMIDCDHHNELDSDADLHPYLSGRWLEHAKTYGVRGPAGGFYPRFMPHREDARPPSGRKSGSEARYTASHFLDPEDVAYAILIPLSPAGGQQNLAFGAALATAVNDWQVAEWLDVDPRFRASITIPFEDPPAAIAEIERRAWDKRFVQVQFSGRPHEPMGRRKYWPIYEACARHGLHVMSHAFGSYGQPITGTGWPSYYLEDHVGPAQAAQASVVSLVMEGVFEQFPIKFISVENGFAWLPSLCWRMDAAWQLLRSEVPHLRHEPSEYVRKHVYASTQPMEEPHKPKYFHQMIEQYGDLFDHVMFASDYPHWDYDDPDQALPVNLSNELKKKIYFENASKLYGLT